MPKPPRPAAPPKSAPTATEQMDRELAARALDKRRKGQSPNAQELSALRRIEKLREDELRWAYYSTIPQKHWRDMSGRQAKVINEQAARYGIPFAGATIDLPAVVRGLHDFLADNASALARSEEAAQEQDVSLNRLRKANAELAELELARKRGLLMPREEVHDAFAKVAGVIRKVTEKLERAFGPEAHEMLDAALQDAERLITDGFNSPQTPNSSDDDGRSDPAGDAPGSPPGVPVADPQLPQAPPADDAGVRRG